MEIPTVKAMLDRIERKGLSPHWFDGGAFPLFRQGDGCLWYRHPDSDTVLKITVEELPRDQWPNMLGGG